MAVLLETTLGDVVIDLYTEERPRGEPLARLAPRRGRYLLSPIVPSLPGPPDWVRASGLLVPTTGLFY